jgi:hypothetical protein
LNGNQQAERDKLLTPILGHALTISKDCKNNSLEIYRNLSEHSEKKYKNPLESNGLKKMKKSPNDLNGSINISSNRNELSQTIIKVSDANAQFGKINTNAQLLKTCKVVSESGFSGCKRTHSGIIIKPEALMSSGSSTKLETITKLKPGALSKPGCSTQKEMPYNLPQVISGFNNTAVLKIVTQGKEKSWITFIKPEIPKEKHVDHMYPKTKPPIDKKYDPVSKFVETNLAETDDFKLEDGKRSNVEKDSNEIFKGILNHIKIEANGELLIKTELEDEIDIKSEVDEGMDIKSELIEDNDLVENGTALKDPSEDPCLNEGTILNLDMLVQDDAQKLTAIEYFEFLDSVT